MTVTIDQPSGKLTVEKPDCIGQFFVIVCKKFGNRYLANCIDANSEGQPKRMRIQLDPVRQGEVLGPTEYVIMEQNPDIGDL